MDTATIAITASVATAGTSILALILSTMHRSATFGRVVGRRVYDTDEDGNERLRISGHGPWTLEEGN